MYICGRVRESLRLAREICDRGSQSSPSCALAIKRKCAPLGLQGLAAHPVYVGVLVVNVVFKGGEFASTLDFGHQAPPFFIFILSHFSDALSQAMWST